jgi:purine nucleoside phosphorylase
MNQATPQTAAARLKKKSPLRPTLAIVLGSGFHHVLTGLRVEKSPLRCGRGWIKVVT